MQGRHRSRRGRRGGGAASAGDRRANWAATLSKAQEQNLRARHGDGASHGDALGAACGCLGRALVRQCRVRPSCAAGGPAGSSVHRRSGRADQRPLQLRPEYPLRALKPQAQARVGAVRVGLNFSQVLRRRVGLPGNPVARRFEPFLWMTAGGQVVSQGPGNASLGGDPDESPRRQSNSLQQPA